MATAVVDSEWAERIAVCECPPVLFVGLGATQSGGRISVGASSRGGFGADGGRSPESGGARNSKDEQIGAHPRYRDDYDQYHDDCSGRYPWVPVRTQISTCACSTCL